MLIDSGSADTWVPSTACQSCGSTHTQLGSSDSDTFTSLNTPFSIQYGTGDVSGNLAMDNLNIAGLALTNYTFAVTTQESSDFADDSVPFDGLMGLARSELSNAGQPTLLMRFTTKAKCKLPSWVITWVALQMDTTMAKSLLAVSTRPNFQATLPSLITFRQKALGSSDRRHLRRWHQSWPQR